jgi:hypothetical protein
MTDFNALTSEAAAVDAAADAQTAPPPEAEPVTGEAQSDQVLSPEAEARGVIDLALSLAAPFFPSLDKIYTEETKDRLAKSAAPLLVKYNISLLIAKWKEEIEFAFVAAPLVLQTVRAVQSDRAARAKASADADKAAAEPAVQKSA